MFYATLGKESQNDSLFIQLEQAIAVFLKEVSS